VKDLKSPNINDSNIDTDGAKLSTDCDSDRLGGSLHAGDSGNS
jgi:hypothetical protein